MTQGPELLEANPSPVVDAPRLLIPQEAWLGVFFRNLRDLLWPPRQPAIYLTSAPGEFWPDVFVRRPLPWGRFATSLVLHAGALAALLIAARLWPQSPRVISPRPFTSADVIYYSPEEYLPPLNSGHPKLSTPQKGQPAHAPQPILSVPPEADNSTQTIVVPPDVKLHKDVPLPNIVAWTDKPTTVAVPMAATTRSTSDFKAPALNPSVVAPAPQVERTLRQAPSLTQSVIAPPPDANVASSRRAISAPQAAVVAPPPSVDVSSTRKIGDLNIGHTQVVAPAPQLPVAEQRTVRSSAGAAGGLANSMASAVPPPPSVQGSNGQGASGRMIALGIHPVAPSGPVEVPAGNRRGTFAANPQGKPGAPGTPDIPGTGNLATSGSDGKGSGAGGSNGKSAAGVPPGISVGAGPENTRPSTMAGDGQPGHAASPAVMAKVTPPRVTSTPPARTMGNENATELEKKVFGDKKFYSLTTNLPNLSSAGGSWVIRFAELKDSGGQGDLTAPVVVKKIDPAYPIDLMQHNVQGTVALYAVIHADGSVSDVRVLRSVDERLDAYASAALVRWHFQPATKNGAPVDLEAMFMIPFKPSRFKSSF
ncbi:MAG: TonB family protein [Acidobacteria bacterium]|nr:TonB family protein [Acidobacteriota bacterium]